MKSNIHFFNCRVLLILMATVLIVSCSDDDDEPNEVRLGESPTLGNYLVDSEGRALYVFSNDVNGSSACTGSCLTNWPVFYEADLKTPAGLNASDFSTITRSDGGMQTTYKGWPLYYFKDDINAMDVKGEGVNGVWFAAKPDYSLLIAADDNQTYFTDAEGRTLYYFLNDTDAQSNCTGGCLANWPVFVVSSAEVIVPSTLNKDDFGMITSNDNKTQLTYKGWPLYYFQNDEARGDRKGDGLNDVWYLVEPGDDFSAAPSVNVKLSASGTLGSYLVDAQGMTLYYFTRDYDGNSSCNNEQCLSAWPVFYVEEVVPGSGLDDSDFETITRNDGSKQTTYKGWPLYYFTPDEAAGDTKGEDVNHVWYVAKPDYTVMIADKGDKKYLVDEAGKTLYVFTDDTGNVSNCSGNCITNWPQFYKEGAMVVPSLIIASDFEVITRGDGNMQLVYKNQPLYYFISDGSRGETTGEGLNTNKWQLAKPIF